MTWLIAFRCIAISFPEVRASESLRRSRREFRLRYGIHAQRFDLRTLTTSPVYSCCQLSMTVTVLPVLAKSNSAMLAMLRPRVYRYA